MRLGAVFGQNWVGETLGLPRGDRGPPGSSRLQPAPCGPSRLPRRGKAARTPPVPAGPRRAHQALRTRPRSLVQRGWGLGRVSCRTPGPGVTLSLRVQRPGGARTPQGGCCGPPGGSLPSWGRPGAPCPLGDSGSKRVGTAPGALAPFPQPLGVPLRTPTSRAPTGRLVLIAELPINHQDPENLVSH